MLAFVGGKCSHCYHSFVLEIKVRDSLEFYDVGMPALKYNRLHFWLLWTLKYQDRIEVQKCDSDFLISETAGFWRHLALVRLV